jgi:hypothetical protein
MAGKQIMASAVSAASIDRFDCIFPTFRHRGLVYRAEALSYRRVRIIHNLKPGWAGVKRADEQEEPCPFNINVDISVTFHLVMR